MTRLLSFLLVLGLAHGVGGAPQREKPLTLSARTDLVTLAVTVVDRRGEPVGGLGREHFRVFDEGELQDIHLFTDDAFPVTLGLVLDSSGSMRGREAYAAAAIAALTALVRPLDQFFTLHFNEAVWPGLRPGVAFTEEPDELRLTLSATSALGMTALYDAIERGLSHLEQGSRDRRALVVMSDGGDNASASDLRRVVAHAHDAGAAIFSLTLAGIDSREANPAVLKALTRQTGGRAVSARRPSDVPRVFAHIARDLRSGYTIGFLQPEHAKAGYRSIRVVVDAGDGRQLIARTRAGYHALAVREPPG